MPTRQRTTGRPKKVYISGTEPIFRERPIAPCRLTTWGDLCLERLAVIDVPWGVRAGGALHAERQYRDRRGLRRLDVACVRCVHERNEERS